MQLILDSEGTLDGNTKMTTFENTILDEKLMNNGVKQNLMNGISSCNKENVQENVKEDTLQPETEETVVEKDDGQAKPEDTLRDCGVIEQVSECPKHESQEAKSNTDNVDKVAEKCVDKSEAFKKIDESNRIENITLEVSNSPITIENTISEQEAFKKNDATNVKELSNKEVPIENVTSEISNPPITIDKALSEQETFKKNDGTNVKQEQSNKELPNENITSEISNSAITTDNALSEQKAFKENDEINIKQELTNEELPNENITLEISDSPITIDNPLSEQDVSEENCSKENEDIVVIESNVKQKELSEIDLQPPDLNKNKEEIFEKMSLLEQQNDDLMNAQVKQEVEAEIQSEKDLNAQNVNEKNSQETQAQSKMNSIGSEMEFDVAAIKTANNNVRSNDICPQNEEEESITTVTEDKNKITENASECSNDLSTDLNHDVIEIVNNDSTQEAKNNASNKEILNGDNIKEKENLDVSDLKHMESPKQTQLKDNIKGQKVYCKLSNTLDILSDDDDDEPQKADPDKAKTENDDNDKQCINIEDDDDIMVIEEDSSKDCKVETTTNKDEKMEVNNECNDNTLINEECNKVPEDIDPEYKEKMESDEREPNEAAMENKDCKIEAEVQDTPKQQEQQKVEEKSLVPDDFFQSCKKNLADMTRDELEEFCIQKIVEGIVDRSNLSEIKSKLKTMTQNNEEYKKKAMMLTKQIRDLQVVLKSVQEEQKKQSDTPITPLKITRSVGMQVLMTDKPGRRKPLGPGPSVNNISNNNKTKGPNNQPVKPQNKTNNNQQTIPVPRLVPATPAKTNNVSNQVTNVVKTSSPVPNGVKTPNPPAQRPVEKRSRMSSICVDLTDDEPPTKISARGSPMPPVRLVPSQNLLAPRPQQFSSQPVQNSPRKVYIPISGPQGPVRPGQTIMLRSVAPSGPRPRAAGMNVVRMQSNQIRMPRLQGPSRHPAPLPDAMKQYQPPNWKALPPAPDLKLSKVENGIVISWKIEGYQEDSYEEIASYQLYAYQETTSPPSTALWKKIGDVKALPLPMACTLTQFMAGYKYYFAVRAVDIRSRLGPFSLPGSILLLNKI